MVKGGFYFSQKLHIHHRKLTTFLLSHTPGPYVYSVYRSLPGKCPWALYHNSRLSAYCTLTWDTGRLLCVKIEVRGAYCSACA